MRRLPKMAAALLAAALAVSAALPALAADQRAELELEASVRCTGEAADETHGGPPQGRRRVRDADGAADRVGRRADAGRL